MKSSLKDFLAKINFDDPSEYDFDTDKHIDGNIRETLKNINKSSWCWTLFSCEGHLCDNEAKTLPYFVFIVKKKYIHYLLGFIFDTLSPNIDQKTDPNAIDPATLAEIQKYSLNIKNWMDQLNAMYPADKETKDLQAEVAEVMKGLPQQTKPTIDQKADNKQAPADNSISKWRNMTGNIT